MTTQDILRAARTVCPVLRCADREQKDAALLAMADRLWSEREQILAANAQDLEAAHTGAVLLDRLALTEERIAGMAEGVRQVAALPDPIGRVDKMETRPNGLIIGRRRVPLGVAAIIMGLVRDRKSGKGGCGCGCKGCANAPYCHPASRTGRS